MFDKADYPIRHSVSHVWHEGVPPFSQGEWGTVTYVLCFPGGCTRTDLSTDHGVYFFRFSRSGITEIGITGYFLRAIVPGLSPFRASGCPALQLKHDYNHCVHNTTVYL